MTKNVSPSDSEKIFLIVEKNATFQGGDISSFASWVNKHIHLPDSVIKMVLRGRLIVQFIVNSKGMVEKVIVLRGVDPILDQEVVKTIMSSPLWKPGRKGGKPINQQFVIPVDFKLSW